MKTLQKWTLIVVLFSIAVAQIGTLHAVAEPNGPKHNQVVVEFPGHKYSLEIAVKTVKETIDGEERTVKTVFAYTSDTHFDPIKVDTKEVRLNFVVDRKPKSFVLLPVKADPRTDKDPKPQSIFELKDPELVKLIESGWQGNATANMSVGRTPYNARLIPAKDFKSHRH